MLKENQILVGAHDPVRRNVYPSLTIYSQKVIWLRKNFQEESSTNMSQYDDLVLLRKDMKFMRGIFFPFLQLLKSRENYKIYIWLFSVYGLKIFGSCPDVREDTTLSAIWRKSRSLRKSSPPPTKNKKKRKKKSLNFRNFHNQLCLSILEFFFSINSSSCFFLFFSFWLDCIVTEKINY